MVKTVAAKTRKAFVRAAQHSAEKIRAVAADAASAATQAAAGVVLASTASALEGAVRKSRNPHPASKRRLDAPQSVRLAGAVAHPADANAPQDGQPLAERRLEKKRRRNAGQNAGRGSFMPQTAARGLPIFGTKTHDVSIRRA